MELYIGKERTRSLISKAVFFISVGTNDFIVNYYGPPIRRKTYTISTYQDFILQLGQQFLQGLLKLGARKIAFVGLPPIGCVPAVITLNSDNALINRGCIERLSSVARDYNRLLQSKLTAMQTHGFEEVNCGCCGSGIIEASILCNPYSLVCSDDSKYVFWDSVHPTEAAYYKVFKDLPRNIANVKTESPSISAILIFGDSTADPGNNNYINTPFRSNFSPYGKDFVNQTATGRFSNGRLANDFIAKYVGVKDYVPPYLDPTLSIEELMSGNVISISEQMEHFKEYREIEAAIGKEKRRS
ncbi:hypothetical protein DH2020_042443 [Rehmannia glutinosa]|uniref:GDSL esterase/lipase n=1 Tax=Rehmannia glutinosa TaxID=99300 RepID=A0ABR0UMK1_REHGL